MKFQKCLFLFSLCLSSFAQEGIKERLDRYIESYEPAVVGSSNLLANPVEISMVRVLPRGKAADLFQLSQNFASERESLTGDSVFCNHENCPESQGLTSEAEGLLNNICDGFFNTVKEGFTTNDLRNIPSGKAQMDNFAGGEVTGSHEILLRQFKYSLEHYVANSCNRRFRRGPTANECLASIRDNEDEFKRACRNRVEMVFFTPAQDLDARYQASIHNFGALLKSSDDHGEEEHLAPVIEGGCISGASNCFFKNDDYQEGCGNALDCALASGEIFAQNLDFSELASHFINSGLNELDLRGNPNFCNNCIRDLHNRTNPQVNFDAAKENYEEKLKNNLAGKKAGKELLKLTRHLEAVKDMVYLKPETGEIADSLNCSAQLEPVLNNNPCGSEVSNSNYQERLREALNFADFPQTNSYSDVISHIESRIDPTIGENSCRRAYAFSKKFTIDNIGNQQYKEALKSLLSQVSDPQYNNLLEENCADGANPNESFIEQYSSQMADNYLEEMENSFEIFMGGISDTITHADIRRFSAQNIALPNTIANRAAETASSLNVQAQLMSGAQSLGMAIPRREMSPKALEYFDRMDREIVEMLRDFMLDDHHVDAISNRASDTEEFDHTFEEFKDFIRENLKSQFANTFYIPMGMDPSFKIALSDWKNVCGLYTQSNITPRRAISDLIDEMGVEGTGARLGQYSSSTCGSIEENLKRALCSNESVVADEGDENGINFSEDDLEKARQEISNLIAPQEKLAGKSLSCEINSQKRNLERDVFQDRNQTEIDDLFLSSLGDYEKQILTERDETLPDPDGGTGFVDFMRDTGCEGDFYVDAVNMGRDPSASPPSVQTRTRHNRNVLGSGSRQGPDYIKWASVRSTSVASGGMVGSIAPIGSTPSLKNKSGGSSIEPVILGGQMAGEGSTSSNGVVASRAISSEGSPEPATGFSDLLGSMRDNSGPSVDLPPTPPYPSSAPACQEVNCVTEVLNNYAELPSGQKTMEARERVAQAVGAHEPEQRQAVSDLLNNPGDAQAVSVLADLVRTKDAQISELTEKFSALQDRMNDLERNESVSFTDSETGQNRTISRAEAQRRLSNRNQVLAPSFSDDVGPSFQNVTDLQRERSRPSPGTSYEPGETSFGSYAASRQAIRESGAETSRLLNNSPQTQAYLTTMSTQPSNDELVTLVQRAQSEGVLGLIVHYDPVTGDPQIKDPQSDRVWNVPPEVRGMIPSSMLELDTHSFLTFAQTTGREPLEGLAAAISELEHFISSEQNNNTRLADLSRIFQDLNGDN